jgi:hypothetical protein
MNMEKINYVMKTYNEENITLDITMAIKNLVTMLNEPCDHTKIKNIIQLSNDTTDTILSHGDNVVRYELLKQMYDIITKLKTRLVLYSDVVLANNLLNKLHQKMLENNLYDGYRNNNNNDKNKIQIVHTHANIYNKLFLLCILFMFFLFILFI